MAKATDFAKTSLLVLIRLIYNVLNYKYIVKLLIFEQLFFIFADMENNIEIIKFNYSNKELFEDESKIRRIVFCGEQSCPTEEEFDGFDSIAIHYLLKYNNKYVCTARRRETKDGIKLERFAVLKEYRGKGLASKIVEFIINDVEDNGKLVYLNAQIDARPLYAKFNFKQVGEKFSEVGIWHYRMELEK